MENNYNVESNYNESCWQNSFIQMRKIPMPDLIFRKKGHHVLQELTSFCVQALILNYSRIQKGHILSLYAYKK